MALWTEKDDRSMEMNTGQETRAWERSRMQEYASKLSNKLYVNLCFSKHALRGLFSSCKWCYPPSSFPPPRALLLFSSPFIAKWMYLLMPAGFQTLSTVVWQASPPKLQRLLIDDRALSHFQTIATKSSPWYGREIAQLFLMRYIWETLICVQMCDETTLTNYLHWPMVAPMPLLKIPPIYYLGVQSCSWRATILQRSAPTLIKDTVTS